MSAASHSSIRIVLYEGVGSRPIPASQRFDLLKSLLEKGYAVSSVRADGQVSPPSDGAMMVLGRFDRPDLLEMQDAAGRIPLAVQDIDGAATADVLQRVDSFRVAMQFPTPGTWKPWFPVIDYSRCTNCMQCLSFCLFDVYGVSPDGKIQVQNQDNCKTDCPACSRVCPEVAILFPKYRSGPINGDEINPEDLRREAMKVDISALLGGDIYSMLRDRSDKAKSRFSKERDEDRALKERQRCLVQLQEQMDIPAEVIGALPSVDQIRAKAEQAKARAQQALSGQPSQPEA